MRQESLTRNIMALKNIIESIKKYEGTYKIDTTENMFKISIILMDVF